MAAYRTSIGRRLQVARGSHRPPIRRGQLRHLPILPRSTLTVARAGVGLGVGLGIALAIGSARKRAPRSRELDAAAPSSPGLAGAALASAPARGSVGAPRSRDLASDVFAELTAQLDLALQTLTRASDADFERAVHDTRKAMKRARSLLRLLRDELPKRRRKRCNAALRAAGRELSASRDADVALATLESVLTSANKRVRNSRGVSRLRALLVHERVSAQRRIRAGGRERALSQLWRARAELSAISAKREPSKAVDGRDRRALAHGISVIYRAGRSAMRRGKSNPTVIAMHTWRKRVKDLRYAAEALAATTDCDRSMKKIARRADKLGETLGEEHDLAVLVEIVRSNKKLFKKDRRGRRGLLRAIAKRRRELRRRAFKHGGRLYELKPKRFKRRVLRALR